MTTDTQVELYHSSALLDLLLDEMTDEEVVDSLGPDDAWLTQEDHGPCAHLRPGLWTVCRYGSRHLGDATIEPLDMPDGVVCEVIDGTYSGGGIGGHGDLYRLGTDSEGRLLYVTPDSGTVWTGEDTPSGMLYHPIS